MQSLRTTLAITAVILGTTLPASLFAEETKKPTAAPAGDQLPPPHHGPGMPPHGGPDQMEERAFSKLKLSAEQKKQMGSLREKKRDQVEVLRSELEGKMRAFGDAFATDTKEAELRAKFQEIKITQDKLAEVHIESILAIRNILTLEQRREFTEHMRGMMMGGPGGMGFGKDKAPGRAKNRGRGE